MVRPVTARNVPHIVAPGLPVTDSTTNTSDTAHSASFLRDINGITGGVRPRFPCGPRIMSTPKVSTHLRHWSRLSSPPLPRIWSAIQTPTAASWATVQTVSRAYGRLDLEQVMNHGVEVFMTDQENRLFFDGSGLVAGSERRRSFLSPFVSCWPGPTHPAPVFGGTTPAWVNNLDLSVDADGDTYLGNVIGLSTAGPLPVARPMIGTTSKGFSSVRPSTMVRSAIYRHRGPTWPAMHSIPMTPVHPARISRWLATIALLAIRHSPSRSSRRFWVSAFPTAVALTRMSRSTSEPWGFIAAPWI